MELLGDGTWLEEVGHQGQALEGCRPALSLVSPLLPDPSSSEEPILKPPTTRIWATPRLSDLGELMVPPKTISPNKTCLSGRFCYMFWL